MGTSLKLPNRLALSVSSSAGRKIEKPLLGLSSNLSTWIYCIPFYFRELNVKAALKQKSDEELRKCRRQLSTIRVELQQVKKELKEKEEHSTLAEEDIKRCTAENAKLQEKLKMLTESISSPSGDPRNSAITRLLQESPAPSHLRMSNIMCTTPATPSTPFAPLKLKAKGGPSQLLSSQALASIRPKLSNPEEQDDKISGDLSSQQRKGKEVRKAEDFAEPDTLKSKRMKLEAVPSTSGFFYDGFGGHSKPDIFPKGASGSSRLGRSENASKKTQKSVTIKVKGKTQTTTLDYFYSQ